MLIKEALNIAKQLCYKSSTPALDARVILCYLLAITHEQLLLRYHDTLSPEEIAQYLSLIERRANLEPVSYITCSKEFYGISYKVSPAVLIPRAETELIIDSVLADHDRNSSISILDLGTGSGILAITLALAFPNAQIVAVDLCPYAILIAQENASNHNVTQQIQFIQSDWFTSLDNQSFNCIVSNPPYIATATTTHTSTSRSLVAPETALYEPNLALYAGPNGMQAYQDIISSAAKFLEPKGKLYLELGYNQAQAVTELLTMHNFYLCKTHQDLISITRVVVATMCD